MSEGGALLISVLPYILIFGLPLIYVYGKLVATRRAINFNSILRGVGTYVDYVNQMFKAKPAELSKAEWDNLRLDKAIEAARVTAESLGLKLTTVEIQALRVAIEAYIFWNNSSKGNVNQLGRVSGYTTGVTLL